MGLFSGIKKGLGGIVGGTLGLVGGLLGGFTSPGVKGMSAAEKRALAEQKAEEAARRTRLLEGQQRRTRVALGAQGGPRSLLYGGGTFAGTDQVTTDAPLDELSGADAVKAPRSAVTPVAATRPPASRARRGWAGVAASVRKVVL